MAYALTVAFTKPLPEDVARDSQFPIIGDLDRKGNTGQGALHLAASYSKLFTISPHQTGVRTLIYPNAIAKTFSATGAKALNATP